jgi:hypothetical protein
MGQRYRFTFTETGDVLDPAAWVEDNNELAAEFNGYLDRDNFARNDIAQAEITANAFTKVEPFTSTSIYTPDNTLVSWQGGAGNDADGIFREAVTCEVDCLLVCELSLGWVWDKDVTDYSMTGVGPSGDPPGTPPTSVTVSDSTVDTIQFRIAVDGVEVARSGLFEDMHHRYGTYILGAKVVTSGVHTVSAECVLMRRRWEGLRQDGANTYTVDISNRVLLVTQEKR